MTIVRAFFLCVCTGIAAAVLASCGSALAPNASKEMTPTLATSPTIVARSAAPQADSIGTDDVLSPDGIVGPVIYLSCYETEVGIYNEANGKFVGQITNGIQVPGGLFVDRHGSLYVANTVAGTVTAYYRGATTPFATWSQDLHRPLYVVVDASGDLFVSNGDYGTVVEFPPGSTHLSRVLHTPGVEADGMDFDRQGNLYVAYRTQQTEAGGSIEKFAPGSTEGTSLGMTLNQPAGLVVDASGKISVVETGGKSRIAHFLVGKTTVSQLLVDANPGQTLGELAYDQTSSKLYVGASNGGDSSCQALEFSYPFSGSSTLAPIITDTGTSGWGIALSNGQTF